MRQKMSAITCDLRQHLKETSDLFEEEEKNFMYGLDHCIQLLSYSQPLAESLL